tara:strand:- start:545 stop:1027 length:483 start_codon:yes stop_codon:yes gene_type:complete
MEFHRGEVKKYEWVDIGSSFLPSEITASFLFAQINNLKNIQKRRKQIWNAYYENLMSIKNQVELPFLPNYASNNAHLFYLVLKNIDQRDSFLSFMKEKGVMSVFHYQSLHSSPFYNNKHDGRQLDFANKYAERLVRLPLFYDLNNEEVHYIIDSVKDFFS